MSLLSLVILACGGAPTAAVGAPAACPETPNCVSDLAAPTDSEHFVAALPLVGDEEAARARLRALIESSPRTQILEDRSGYLHATYTSRLLRFVDDLELWLDPEAGKIHVRSASRVGEGDMGVNRARVADLSARWATEAAPKAGAAP